MAETTDSVREPGHPANGGMTLPQINDYKSREPWQSGFDRRGKCIDERISI